MAPDTTDHCADTPLDRADVVVVGAGAAGLMAAIHAGRTARAAGARPRIVALDGARRLGAKILVAGGGRCNVTHHAVDASAYAGSTRPAIRKVLRRFDVQQTRAFFAELGVELKREDTGKLFPTTDRARDVLDALLHAADMARVTLDHPRRVESVTHETNGDFRIRTERGELTAPIVVLATGGSSLPKSGSDGRGHVIARRLGHAITDPILPSLVPLKLAEGHALRSISGVTVTAEVRVLAGSGKRLAAFTNGLLCTHFGLSGPSVLDASRWYLHAVREDPAAALEISWAPGEDAESIERLLRDAPERSALAFARRFTPESLARVLLDEARVAAGDSPRQLTKERRRALARAIGGMRVAITGDRGFTFAETTAGGVPLAELRLQTMESRVRPGLFVIGEVCDVDGRIGGFNFQWAWASGFVAGRAIGERLASGVEHAAPGATGSD